MCDALFKKWECTIDNHLKLEVKIIIPSIFFSLSKQLIYQLSYISPSLTDLVDISPKAPLKSFFCSHGLLFLFPNVYSSHCIAFSYCNLPKVLIWNPLGHRASKIALTFTCVSASFPNHSLLFPHTFLFTFASFAQIWGPPNKPTPFLFYFFKVCSDFRSSQHHSLFTSLAFIGVD